MRLDLLRPRGKPRGLKSYEMYKINSRNRIFLLRESGAEKRTLFYTIYGS